MNSVSFKKGKISVLEIGKQRFWFGVIVGLFSALSISLLFNRIREITRFISGVSSDLIILEEPELLFFNYFFAALSSVLGFSITIWIWMGNFNHNRRKHILYKQQARTNALFIFWLILFLTATLSFLLIIIFSNKISIYDYPVNLYKEYSLLFILLPVVIFFHNWFSVRLIYKAGKWIFISLIVCITTTYILFKTTTTNQKKLNEIYFEKHKKAYNYIDSIKIKSEINYNIKFSNKAIKTVKQWHSYTSNKQVKYLKDVFTQERIITIDTIILEKLCIHTSKKSSIYYYDDSPYRNWPYALPKDVLKQINYFKHNSNETKELFEILREEIKLINTSEIGWKGDEYYLKAEYNAKFPISELIVIDLITVRDSLLNLKKYSHLHSRLPKINYTPKKVNNSK